METRSLTPVHLIWARHGVVEHVEDIFDFLRKRKQKGKVKLFHIPLEAHLSAILRGSNAPDSVGHIHLFTIETALRSVERSGQRVIDWTPTDGALELPNKGFRTKLANIPRRVLGMISKKLSARLLGGYSILILAE